MKRITNILIITLLALMFDACEYTIDYEGDLAEKVLVLDQFLEADSTINLVVTASFEPWNCYQNPEKYVVKNANARIIVNGQTEYTGTYNNKTRSYKFNYIPQRNDVLDVKISHEDYPTLSTQARFDIDFAEDEIVQASSEITYEINKEYNEVVFYRLITLELYNLGEGYYMLDRVTTNYGIPESESPSGVYYDNCPGFSFGDISESYNDYGIFSSKMFSNGHYKLRMKPEIYRAYYQDESYIPQIINDPSLQLVMNSDMILYKIDKASFLYLQSLNRSLYSKGMAINPINIRHAVENGYGFLGVRKRFIFR